MWLRPIGSDCLRRPKKKWIEPGNSNDKNENLKSWNRFWGFTNQNGFHSIASWLRWASIFSMLGDGACLINLLNGKAVSQPKPETLFNILIQFKRTPHAASHKFITKTSNIPYMLMSPKSEKEHQASITKHPIASIMQMYSRGDSQRF